VLLVEIALIARDSAYSYTFLRGVVGRLSVVCHIRAPC